MKKISTLFTKIFMTLLCLMGTSHFCKAMDLQRVLKAGDNEIHSYRIPSLVSMKNGELLLFAEGRLQSWKDRSPTVVVLKRSIDAGKTFLPMQILNQDSRYSFCDPCALVDNKTETVFVFYTAWDRTDHSNVDKIKVFYQISKNKGETWSNPKLLKQDFNYGRIIGLAPGSGLQIKRGIYKNRLILPVRIHKDKKTHCMALYSMNGGNTWHYAGKLDRGGECQIAEIKGNLHINVRRSEMRFQALSKDGGKTWSKSEKSEGLLAPERGCQGSVFGIGKTLIYVGPEGVKPHNGGFDNRGKLTLWRSKDDGATWEKVKVLYDKAAGYSCITQLPNKQLAIIFEEADTPSFVRQKKRAPQWMNLSLLIVPESIYKF